MNPRNLLATANDLLSGNRESDWRGAISRAYYATFHVARDLFRRWGFAVPKAEQAHAYLSLRLSNCHHPDLVQAGRDLNDLRSQRNAADYDLDRPYEENRALRWTQLAEDVVRLLDQVPASPHVERQTVEAVRVYERDVLRDVTWSDPKE